MNGRRPVSGALVAPAALALALGASVPVGRALGDCGLDVRAARVETLGAEVVDVFYVTDAAGLPLADTEVRRKTVSAVLAALGG